MDSFPFPSRELALEELRQDIGYKKLTAEGVDTGAAVDRAWETGAGAARELFRETGGERNFRKITKKKGLRIRREYKDNVQFGRRYFSEYYTGKNELILYMGAVSKWADRNGMSEEEAENLILAHEMFHFLENTTEMGLCSKQVSVPVLTVFGVPIGKTGVRALSEIGAHAFARTYYGLADDIQPKKQSEEFEE